MLTIDSPSKKIQDICEPFCSETLIFHIKTIFMMSLKNYDVTGVKTFHILNFNLISTILSLIFKALPRTLIIEARNKASRSSDNLIYYSPYIKDLIHHSFISLELQIQLYFHKTFSLKIQYTSTESQKWLLRCKKIFLASMNLILNLFDPQACIYIFNHISK